MFVTCFLYIPDKLLLIQLLRVYYRSWLLRFEPYLILKDLKNSKLIILWNIYFFKDILPNELIMANVGSSVISIAVVDNFMDSAIIKNNAIAVV